MLCRRSILGVTFLLSGTVLNLSLIRFASGDWSSSITNNGLNLSRLGSSSKPFGYAKMDALWPHVFGKETKVNVCWQQAERAQSEEAAAVREIIAQTWSRYARIDFDGWSVCVVHMPGVHINVEDKGPYVKALGRQLDGVDSGMTLNFDMKNWQGDSWCVAARLNKFECIKAVAIHEFGHALGLAHEQNRPDTPGECQELPQGPMGNKTLTPWDATSVMNYCNNIYRSGGARLSAGDIVSIRRMYSKRGQ